MKSIMDASVSNLYEEGYLQRNRRPYNINRVCPALPAAIILSLAIVQILVGLTCAAIQIAAIIVDMDGYYIALGLSFGFPYLLAGSLGCAAAHKKTIRLVNAFRRFSLVSAFLSGFLLIAYTLFFITLVLPKYCNSVKPYKCKYKIIGYALIVGCMAASVVSGILSVVICKRATEESPRFTTNGAGRTQLLHLEDQDRRPYGNMDTLPENNNIGRSERSSSCHSPARLEPRPATVPFNRQRSGSEPPFYSDMYPPIHRSLITND